MFYYENAAKRRGFKIIAGVDEAGRGPLAGPVVAAAVILKTADFDNRIDDSKKLTDSARRAAFDEILAKSFVGIGIVNENVIDRVNISSATNLAVKIAVEDLPLEPDFVYLDGSLNPDIDIPYKSVIKGDAKIFSVACASIVAKVIRDRIMGIYDSVYPEYGFIRHKGYGTKIHIGNLKKFKRCRIHRRSFSYE